ncbi:MAG: hypothetical protein ACAH06_04000 [Methylophilaceae bacterium]|jgi:hypothetical protein|uniref:hypothetical protein n=1 Tax=Methylobacillus sp. MM3 TaxID=1848039 RepID=UPI0007DEF1FC|nr:hypothetical protein [Methylobacillus sp. MM3]OAJ71012.1 hypothetical protein A7976_06110 [Methylobacillus sp. MM3]
MNQKMLEHLGEHADKYPTNLEQKYPHVFHKLVEFWGTTDMRPYFDELIMSNRPNRLGFPPETVTEIWALSKLYSTLHPEHEPPESISAFGDIWNVDVDAARDSWKQQQAGEKQTSAEKKSDT